MNHKFLLSILFILLTAFSANAQMSVKPGDKIIRSDWIKSSHDFYRNVITDTSGNIKYDFMMEDFCLVDTVKKRIIFARSRQVPAGNFSTDTSITNLTFRPLQMHEVHQTIGVNVNILFDEKNATVNTNRKGVATVKNYPMVSGYFEDNMIEYIFGYLLLEKGQTYVMNNFNPATSGNDPYTIRYEFDDIWTLSADLKINCMVLYFTHGTTSGYIWIDKSSHKVLKTLGRTKNYSYVLTKV